MHQPNQLGEEVKSTLEIPDLFPRLPDPCTPNDLIDQGIRSRSTLNRDIASGRLPAYRLGGRLFIRKADVLAMVVPVKTA